MPRIVHLGLGNFHRAHQAWYTHRANQRAGEDWAITGVTLRNTDLRDGLAASNGAYSLGARGPSGLDVTRIAVHDRILVAHENPDAVIDAIADADTQVVTLTITEKGYCLGRDGALDLDAPAIAADLASDHPRSAIGLLAHGLARRARHGAPISVVSCDNLSENGTALAAAVQRFAAAAGLGIDAYLASRVAFPNTMVDRITPATTEAIRAEIADATGEQEPFPVLTEAFSEWIIEDRFAAPRPDWGAVGAVLTDDVAPFEARKLRCLNGAHSTLAHGGLLRGHEFVHEAFADPALRRLIDTLWQEAAASLPADMRPTLPAYLEALSQRFAVPEMRHRLDQIATDGSQKIPVRLAPVLSPDAPQTTPGAVTACAAWIAYLARFGPEGRISRDDGAAELVALAQGQSIADLTAAALRHITGSTPSEPLLADTLQAVQDWLGVPS